MWRRHSKNGEEGHCKSAQRRTARKSWFLQKTVHRTTSAHTVTLQAKLCEVLTCRTPSRRVLEMLFSRIETIPPQHSTGTGCMETRFKSPVPRKKSNPKSAPREQELINGRSIGGAQLLKGSRKARLERCSSSTRVDSGGDLVPDAGFLIQ